MDRINQNRIQNIGFRGIKPKVESVKTMEELIKTAVENLHKKAQTRAVPEYGEFEMVYELFKNPDKSLKATGFMLKITKPRKSVENHEIKRYLELVAYNVPEQPSPYMKDTSQYVAEKLLFRGTKDELVKELENPELYDRIKEQAVRLSKDLESI